MEKLKKLLDLKKPIACYTILGSTLLTSIILIATLVFGTFSSITTISALDATYMIFNAFDGISWISLLELIFGAGTLFALFISIKHGITAIKDTKLFIRSFKAESNFEAHALRMRETLLGQCCLFALYCICGYALCGFEFSGWAIACTIVLIVAFTLSTTALMFIDEELPSVSFIAIEAVRYALVPTLCVLLFRFVCQPGIIRSTGYKITSFLDGMDNLGDDVEGTYIAQTIYNVIAEPVLLIIATVFITILVFSVLDNLTPKRIARPDEEKPPVYRFKKLGIYLTICLAVRTICALFLNENGVDFELEGFLKTTFNLSRNDLLPAVLIAFAGFFLIKIIYERNESFLSTSKAPEEPASVDEASTTASAPADSAPAPIVHDTPSDVIEPAQKAPAQETLDYAEKTMFCRFCGTKIKASSNFCPSCGQKLQ